MTDLNTEILMVSKHDREDRSHDLLVSIIRENPNATRVQQIAAFKQIVLDPDAILFLDDIIEEWASLNYNSALRSAFPPSLKSIADKKKGADAAQLRMVDAARAVIKGHILDLIMPNGQPLRENTGADCRRAGGWFLKIADKVKPTEKVGDILTEDSLTSLWTRTVP